MATTSDHVSEFSEAVELENGYSFRPETERLSAWGVWLEAIVDQIEPLPSIPSPRHPSLEIVDVDTYARAEGLGEGVDDIQSLAEEFDYDNPTVRFSIARLIARNLFDTHQNLIAGDGELKDNFGTAYNLFREAGRLETSGLDVVSSRILLPTSTFEEMCAKYKHEASYLASIYDVPIGAVAVRQKVAHYPRAKYFNVPEYPELAVA